MIGKSSTSVYVQGVGLGENSLEALFVGGDQLHVAALPKERGQPADKAISADRFYL